MRWRQTCAVLLAIGLMTGCAGGTSADSEASRGSYDDISNQPGDSPQDDSNPEQPASSPEVPPFGEPATVDEWSDASEEELVALVVAQQKIEKEFRDPSYLGSGVVQSTHMDLLADELRTAVDACLALPPVPDAAIDATWQRMLAQFEDASQSLKIAAAGGLSPEGVQVAIDDLEAATASAQQIRDLLP